MLVYRLLVLLMRRESSVCNSDILFTFAKKTVMAIKSNMSRVAAHIAAFVVVSIWGSTFVFTKLLIRDGMSPTEIFFVRFAIAYAAMWAVCRGGLWCKNLKDEKLCALAGLCGGSLYFIAENSALQYTGAADVALIVCTAPVFTILLSGILSVSYIVWAGTLLALVGASVVIFGGNMSSHINLYGGLLAFAAAVCWAVYTVVSKRLITVYGARFVARKVFFYGLVTALPFVMKGLPETDWKNYSMPGLWVNLMLLGLVASCLCFVLWGKAVDILGPVMASNYLYFNPVSAAVFGNLILGERLTLSIVSGMLMILVGVYITGRFAEDRCRGVESATDQ